MGVAEFTINLDHPDKIFRPGDVVSGRVILTIDEEPLINNGIEIKFWGVEQTTWKETHRSGHAKGGTECFGDTTIFDLFCSLTGQEGNIAPIPIGDNIFPFSFRVPSRYLPSSFEFEEASVVYGLQVYIRRKNTVQTDLVPVTIVSPNDLDNIPGAFFPAQSTQVKRFGYCFGICKSEPCILESYTSRLGYAPGDILPFTLEVFNGSNKAITEMKAAIIQEWTFVSYRDGNPIVRKRQSRICEEQRPGDISAGDSTIWIVEFEIPADTPLTTSSNFKGLTKVEYYIRVTCNFYCQSKKLFLFERT